MPQPWNTQPSASIHSIPLQAIDPSKHVSAFWQRTNSFFGQSFNHSFNNQDRPQAWDSRAKPPRQTMHFSLMRPQQPRAWTRLEILLPLSTKISQQVSLGLHLFCNSSLGLGHAVEALWKHGKLLQALKNEDGTNRRVRQSALLP